MCCGEAAPTSRLGVHFWIKYSVLLEAEFGYNIKTEGGCRSPPDFRLLRFSEATIYQDVALVFFTVNFELRIGFESVGSLLTLSSNEKCKNRSQPIPITKRPHFIRITRF